LCKKGEHNPNGYAAAVYLYASDLVLEQSSQPTISNVEGELASAPILTGTADVAFHAEDPGSGVYQAVFTVDGNEAGRTVLNENGGHCRDVGQTSDGLPAFLYLKPCAPTLNADLPFDTTTLTDGAHHLVMLVTDAAGNSTVALDRKIMVSNHPQVNLPQQPSSTEQGAGTVAKNEPATQNSQPPQTSFLQQLQSNNGTDASAGATLQVRWSATARVSLVGVYDHAQAVVGRLAAPDGAAIGGASVQVLSTPNYEGATSHVLATVRTAGDGSFRLRLPAGTPSSRITFTYSNHPMQAVPDVTATLELTVAARLTLKVTPRASHIGGTIVFSGRLLGAPLPSGGKQVVLEARTPRGSWHQFQVLSTAFHGHYRARYRFRLAGPITYEFKAVSRKEADFPYTTGASNVVSVLER
jgi:hypothetical protein